MADWQTPGVQAHASTGQGAGSAIATLSDKLEIEITATGNVRADIDRLLRELEKGAADAQALLDKTSPSSDLFGLRERAAATSREMVEQVRRARASIDETLKRGPGQDPSDARIKIAEIDLAASGAAQKLGQLGQAAASAFGPAGRAVGDVARAAGDLGLGLDKVLSKAGLSTTALFGIGATAVGIYAVGSALFDAARRAEEFESALIRAASVDPSKFESSLADLKRDARDLAQAYSLDQVESAKLLATARIVAPGSESRQKDLVVASGTAALAQAGVASEIARATADLQAAFRSQDQSASALINAAGVASASLREGLLGIIETTREAAPDFQGFGVSAVDAFALLSSSAKASGQSLVDVRSGYRSIIEAATDLNSQARTTLESAGVDFAGAGRGLEGILNLAAQIQQQSPEVLTTAFGNPAQVSKVKSALSTVRQDVRSVQADIAKQPDFLRNLAEKIGDQSSEKIKRLGLQFEALFQDAGSAFTDLAAKIAGKDLKLPVDVALPGDIPTLFDQVLANSQSGDIQSAQAGLKRLQSLARDGVTLYAQAFAEARDRELERETANVTVSGTLGIAKDSKNRVFDAQRIKDEFLPARTEKAFLESLGSLASVAESVVQDAIDRANPKPVGVALKPRIDPAIAEIDRVLRDYRFVVNLQVGTPTAEVENAVTRLTEIKTEAKGLPLQGRPAAEAAGLARIVSQFSTTRAQLDDTLSAIVAENSGGIARMALEMRASEQRVADAIYKAELAPNDLSSALIRLEEFKQANNEKLAATYRQKTGELEGLRLNETTQSLEKARELALAQGNVNQADALAVQIIEAKAAAGRQATEAADAARRLENRGLYGTVEVLDEIRKRQLEQVEADRQGALEAQRRAQAERESARATLFLTTRNDALQGLEAELAKLEQIRSERDALAQGDTRIRFGLDQEEVDRLVAFNRALEERDRAIAERNATLFQAETIGRSLNEITGSYDAQVASLRILRGLEEARLRDSQISAGVERELLEQQLRLYGLLTDKAQERLAVQEALKNAAETTRTNLLENAAGEAGRRGLQGTERDEFIRSSQNGSGAFDQGFTSGVLDATRALTDFSAGLRTGQQLVGGFRDSTSTALQGIGSKSGGDVLREFARSNLENIRRVFADNAADTITKGLFTSLLGKDAAGKLATPDQRLAQAGLDLSSAAAGLSAAAQLLQDAAFGSGERALALLGPSELAGTTIPGAVSGIPLTPQGAQGPTLAGPPVAPTELQGPNPDGSTVEQGASQLGQAGQVAGSALTAGARQAAASIAQGGQSFLQNFLGGFGGKLSEALSGGILNGLGISGSFAEGGVYSGVSMRSSLSPKANRLGGVYSQRTLIEVAEVPGAQEAVIPLRGGAIPVEMRGAPQGARRRNPIEDGIVELARDFTEVRRTPGGTGEGSGSRATTYDPFAAAPGRQAPDRVQRAIDVAPARGGSRAREGGRAVRVTHAPTVNVSMSPGTIVIHASPGTDTKAIADQVTRQLAEQVPKIVTGALANGTDRRLTNAVRDAVR